MCVILEAGLVKASREGVKASRGDVTRDEVSELPKQLNL